MPNIGSDKQAKKQLETNSSSRADELELCRQQKRLQQHQHWMRVMMEGQATPDLRYQKHKE